MNVKFFLEGNTAHWDDSGERIVLNNNTQWGGHAVASGVVMLWPVRFQCADSLDLN